MPDALTGRPLGPDWRVALDSPTELVLERTPTPARRVGGALVVALGALAIAALLFGAAPPDARLILWPLSGALLVVALLALPAAARHLQQARLGVRLRITRQHVEGWPLSMWALRPRTWPATEVAQARVENFAHPPLTLGLFEVVLRDGTRLVGPEVSVQAGQPSPLEPVHAAARHLLAR